MRSYVTTKSTANKTAEEINSSRKGCFKIIMQANQQFGLKQIWIGTAVKSKNPGVRSRGFVLRVCYYTLISPAKRYT